MSRDPELGIGEMLGATTSRLAKIHRDQVHREPWPRFEAFDRDAWPAAMREAAAVQWAGRARAEHGSVQQFSQLAHALTVACVPLHLHGALARMITDEVRHAELCAEMALACAPPRAVDVAFAWPSPMPPWPPAPLDRSRDAILAWAAGAIAIACCLAETLSRPMLDAIATVATCPIAEAVARQIGRDEHLHASFGWDALVVLLPTLDDGGRRHVERSFSLGLGALEQSTCCGIGLTEVAGQALTIARGEPNLGTLTDLQYAMIFYATIEGEILPRIGELGLDAAALWSAR
ncbi:MAG: hypothetical protein IPK74_10985 [Deltaproteobacteria bacterium]|nr:hypothetical protein [Deltaproteobacteria bacterium]